MTLEEGSSPLARGTRHGGSDHAETRGLIPARAGNTTLRHLVSNSDRAHPRSRGEHCPSLPYKLCSQGSSPLARGTRFGGRIVSVFLGLIPARAGNTLTCCWYFFSARAHPRSRGEHARSSSTRVTTQGSSPLARGTPQCLDSESRSGGLIPARAGNTAGRTSGRGKPWAHPRSRGEPGPVIDATLRIGLIPARAGNTTVGASRRGRGRAHPRSRGEHLAMDEIGGRGSGSSPLARGTPGRC